MNLIRVKQDWNLVLEESQLLCLCQRRKNLMFAIIQQCTFRNKNHDNLDRLRKYATQLDLQENRLLNKLELIVIRRDSQRIAQISAKMISRLNQMLQKVHQKAYFYIDRHPQFYTVTAIHQIFHYFRNLSQQFLIKALSPSERYSQTGFYLREPSTLPTSITQYASHSKLLVHHSKEKPIVPKVSTSSRRHAKKVQIREKGGTARQPVVQQKSGDQRKVVLNLCARNTKIRRQVKGYMQQRTSTRRPS